MILETRVILTACGCFERADSAAARCRRQNALPLLFAARHVAHGRERFSMRRHTTADVDRTHLRCRVAIWRFATMRQSDSATSSDHAIAGGFLLGGAVNWYLLGSDGRFFGSLTALWRRCSSMRFVVAAAASHIHAAYGASMPAEPPRHASPASFSRHSVLISPRLRRVSSPPAFTLARLSALELLFTIRGGPMMLAGVYHWSIAGHDVGVVAA